ncbi:MAG: hypothetical protein ACOCXP_00855 [Candidatus Dojkabacteria bacterium]
MKAFTIIEIILVISIVVLVIALALFRLNPSQILEEAGNSRRVQGVREIVVGLEQYAIDNNGAKPTTSGSPLPEVTESTIFDDGVLVQDLDGLDPNYLIITTQEIARNNYYVGSLSGGGILVAVSQGDNSPYYSRAVIPRGSAPDPIEETALYYFDSFGSSSWDFGSTNVVDGNLSSYGQDNEDGEQMRLISNTSGAPLGDITRVELRLNWAWNNGANTYAYLQPYFSGTNPGNVYPDNTQTGNNLPGGGEYSPWFNITRDPAAPSNWTWSDITNLDLALGLDRNGWGLMRVYIVQLRVTYTN